MVKSKDNKWQITDIVPVGNQLPAPVKTPQTPLPKETQDQINKDVPLPPPAPQAVGMMTKEIGDMIRADMLSKIFGAEASVELVKWYRSQTLGITRIPYDGTKLPKFKKGGD